MLKSLNIVQEGGIGDLIVSIPLIELYFKHKDYKINLYTSFPYISKLFLPFVDSFSPIQDLKRDRNNFDFIISITDMVYFSCKNEKSIPDHLKEMYTHWQENFSPSWQEILKKHPFSANEMAHKALSFGQRRWTLPFYSVGKDYIKYDLNGIEDVNYPKEFITIHDGFDASGHYKFMRSTKSWSVESWAEFIKLFKQKYPHINIVQLGGVKHNKIKGVDLNFAGQLDFKNSLRFLRSSLLHIDGDSGLVHARRLFNKKSIVIFGATNVDYFGYPENINLRPNFCGDCWWIKSDWMQNCKEGFSSPKCIDSILPRDVLNAVEL